MKSLLRILFVLMLLTGTLSPQSDVLTILYTGDSHSCLAPLGPRNEDLTGTQGGIARAASVIGMYETSGQKVISLHAGDFSIGDLFYNQYFGVPELQILNSLGLDAMAVGNHEFDLTPVTLLGALTAAFPDPATGFPLLSANADYSVVPGLPSYIKPYTTKTFGDLKVGIFGLTTHAANLLSNPGPVVIQENFLETAGLMVQQLLTVEQCDFIICLSHYGFLADQAIAAYVPGINLIIGGHDHFPKCVQIGNTWLVEAEAFYKSIGKITFEIGTDITMLGNEFIILDETIPEEPTVKATVDYLITGIENVYGEVYTSQIARSSTYLEEYSYDMMLPGNQSTPAGNFVADAMKWYTGTDFAMVPNGALAHPVEKGPIVPADLFRTVGYGFNTVNGLGFRVVKAKILGMDLYAALETVLGMGDEEFLPQFSGLKLKYVLSAAPGEKIAQIKINNTALNPMAVYSFTTDEMVIMVLDALGISYTDLVVFENYSEFQNLCDYVAANGGKITPSKDARLIAEDIIYKENDKSGVPAEFMLAQNYPNPFNPSTTISFSVPVDSKIRISVYNVIGEEVAVLADDFRTAGKYNITWNADNLPGGVYLLSMSADEFSQTRKMVLLK